MALAPPNIGLGGQTSGVQVGGAPTTLSTQPPSGGTAIGGAPGFGPGGWIPESPLNTAPGSPVSSVISGLTNYFGSNPRPAAPPAPSVPPYTGNMGTGGPTTVDLSMIDSMPGVANALALEQSGLGQLDAQLNAARQQAIINFGDPSLAAQAGFGLDPQAGAFARQNYLSGNATLARLDKAHQLAAQAVVNALASHGILNSGDLGYKEGQENQAYGNNVYDAQQSVLSQLSGLYNNYLSSRMGLEQNANNAQLDALNMFLQNPDLYSSLFGGGGGGGGGTGATASSLLGGGTRLPGATTTRTKTAAKSILAGLGGQTSGVQIGGKTTTLPRVL